MRKLPHLPALDGLRGLAVLGVLLFHSDGLLAGGFLGVDLFFVLSGYLITSLLLAERLSTGRIDFAAFWVRRARRLFPALLGLFPAIAAYAWWVASPEELAGIRGDALATLAYVANWRAIWIDKDYWSLFLAPSPLEHTWSLAIEEQFYILWPLAFGALAWLAGRAPGPHGKARLRLYVGGVALVLALGSHLLMARAFNPDDVSRAYLGTDTRAGSILLGVTLAALLPPGSAPAVFARNPKARALLMDALGLLAFCALGWCWFTWEGKAPWLYRGGFLFTELLCLTVMAAAVSNPGGVLARGLSVRWLTWLGTLSYGVYLWHWPVFCVLTRERLGLAWPAVHVLRYALTFGIAYVSFRFYEQPIRLNGLPPRSARTLVPLAFAGCYGLVALVVGLRPVPPSAEAAPGALLQDPAAALAIGRGRPGIFSMSFHDMPPAAALPAGTPRLLVLGDSVANKLGTAMRYRQEEFGVFLAERGVGNCSILQDPGSAGFTREKEARVCSANWTADVAALHPDVTLVVLGGGYFSRALVDGEFHAPCTAQFERVYTARLRELLQALGPSAGRVVLTRVPYPIGKWRSAGLLEKVDCYNALLLSVAGELGLPVVDLMQYVCPTSDCELLSNGHPIRPDGLHFDGVGAEESARFTLRRVLELTRGAAPVPLSAALSAASSAASSEANPAVDIAVNPPPAQRFSNASSSSK